jgi:DNA-directed RNA polymerase specialized sigma24 family protein
VSNEAHAAEIAQETFVRIHQNRAKFHAGWKFSNWLDQRMTRRLPASLVV